MTADVAMSILFRRVRGSARPRSRESKIQIESAHSTVNTPNTSDSMNSAMSYCRRR